LNHRVNSVLDTGDGKPRVDLTEFWHELIARKGLLQS